MLSQGDDVFKYVTHGIFLSCDSERARAAEPHCYGNWKPIDQAENLITSAYVRPSWITEKKLKRKIKNQRRRISLDEKNSKHL